MTQEPIIKYEEISGNFGDEMVTYMIDSFEKMTFNEKMNNLLSGMIERDWVKAMIAAHTMKGSSGYISAKRFMEACKNFQEIIKEHCNKLDANIGDPSKVDAAGFCYELKDTFDDIKQLNAYDLFYPLINEAILLKKEMSKNTKSACPEDIYQKELQLIKDNHREFKARVIQHKTNSIQQLSLKSLPSRPVIVDVPSNNTQIDPPVSESQCCKKCVIF